MTQRERMQAGLIYDPGDPEILEEQGRKQDLLHEFNSTRPSQQERRQQLLKEILASFGENSIVEPPLRANWAGTHLHIGSGVFINFNLTAVDDDEIFIGDHVMLGPNVTLITASHPFSPELRMRGYQYNRPVHIEDNVWLAAGVIVVPGVTVGRNSIIGAGSVVTRDIPPDVFACGNPCRVKRPLGEEDRRTFDHGKTVDWENLMS